MVNASLPEPWVDSSAVWFPCNDNLCNMENLRGFPGLFLKDLWFKILPGEFHDAISCWCSSWFRVMVIVEFLSLWCISFHQKKGECFKMIWTRFSDARRSWMIPGRSRLLPFSTARVRLKVVSDRSDVVKHQRWTSEIHGHGCQEILKFIFVEDNINLTILDLILKIDKH